MSLIVACRRCGKEYRMRDAHAGRKLPRKACGASLRVPEKTTFPQPLFLLGLSAGAVVLLSVVGFLGYRLWFTVEPSATVQEAPPDQSSQVANLSEQQPDERHPVTPAVTEEVQVDNVTLPPTPVAATAPTNRNRNPEELTTKTTTDHVTAAAQAREAQIQQYEEEAKAASDPKIAEMYASLANTIRDANATVEKVNSEQARVLANTERIRLAAEAERAKAVARAERLRQAKSTSKSDDKDRVSYDGLTFGPPGSPTIISDLKVLDWNTQQVTQTLNGSYDDRGFSVLSPDGEYFAATDKSQKGTFYFNFPRGGLSQMPRTSRASQGGFLYHVLNRGNARNEVSRLAAE